MKALLPLFLFPILSFAQTKADSSQIKDALLLMRDNLNESHEYFVDGSRVFIAGSAVIGLGIAFDEADIVKHEMGNFIIFSGAGMAAVGGIYMLISHRYIGRAGNWEFTPTSVSLKF